MAEDLQVDDSIAMILYSHAFRSAEEIKGVSLEEFLQIPGMDPDSLKNIHAKAAVAVENKKNAPVAKPSEEGHVQASPDTGKDVVKVETPDGGEVLKRKAQKTDETEALPEANVS